MPENASKRFEVWGIGLKSKKPDSIQPHRYRSIYCFRPKRLFDHIPKQEVPANIFLLLLILFFVFFCCTGCWQYRPRVEAYLKAAHESWGFNGAVSISKNGRLLFSRGYGLANQQIGAPNTPMTRFFIGSITKQFTAAAILALQEDHLLNLDDPITKYLADYPHDPGDRITIKNLLTHTSGIPNYTEDPEIILRRTQSISPKEIIERIENRPLEFEPGTRFRYSNSGYILLGRIIEVASGQSFEAYLHHRIFRPAGMKNTGYGRRESAVPDRADGYTLSRNGSIVDAIPVDY
jgi:CubicO group peptidase (beta-lactamase class C family)